MLKPLVNFGLAHSLKIQDFSECVKTVFVQAAVSELRRNKQKISQSKVAVITGLHRREVVRILLSDEKPLPPANLITNVIGHWVSNKRFSRPSGGPAVLSVEGADSEFVELVRSVSSDLNPYTVLFELERVGIVERVPRGIRLVTNSYTPKSDLREGSIFMSEDVADLIACASKNLDENDAVPNLHLKTQYDNVSKEHKQSIKLWFMQKGLELHTQAREFLSAFDRDINPELPRADSKIRVALGTFGFVEELEK